MYNYYFQIAGLVLELDSPVPIAFLPCMEPFQTKNVQKVDLHYQIKIEELSFEDEDAICKGDFSVLQHAGRFVRAKRVSVNNQILSTFLYPLDKKGWYILHVPKNMVKNGQLFDAMQIWNFLAPEDGMMVNQAFVLHSSFVAWQGRGILFSAPSGTGKSTQANLWQQYEGAEIYNGDRTIIRKIDGVYHGFGSPYAGSSGIYRNETAPIRAIVVLTQASENRIEQLSGKKAFLPLYQETLMNTWNPVYMENMMDLLMDAAKNIPVYHFACRPDRDAVNLVKKTLFQGETSYFRQG